MINPTRQQQIDRLIQQIREMLVNDLYDEDDRQAEAQRIFTKLCDRLQLTPAEQGHVLAAVGDRALLHMPGAISLPAGEVHISGGTVHGVVAGVVLGNIIYGRDPAEDERRRLVRYLQDVERVYGHLSLRGLAVKDLTDVELSRVYITLATDATRLVVEGSRAQIDPYVEEERSGNLSIKQEFHPDWELPDTAIVAVHAPEIQPDMPAPGPSLVSKIRGFFSAREETRRAGRSDQWQLLRAELATEAIADERTLVLLGDPGGGKSVLLRHVAWQLARAGVASSGQAGSPLRLPLLLPLRQVAGALAASTLDPVPTIVALFDTYAREKLASASIDDGVREALSRGAALVLFDGLDEVPLVGSAPVASRATVLEAVAQFARVYAQVGVVLTCRVRAFDDATRQTLRWPVRTLAPFTLGQVRHFLDQWYAAIPTSLELSATRAAESTTIILNALEHHEALHDMATSPLLLTLMAQIVYSSGELPRDRPQLYEKMLELLLGEWDRVKEGEDLAAVLGAGWDSKRILRLLDQLSYEAHRDASSKDGRGRLQRAQVRERMLQYFIELSEGKLVPWQVAETVEKCLHYIEQRSGLLVPDGNQDYVFAHLTFQEHCAGRYLLTHQDAAQLVMAQRGEDRWREPLMLGIGVIQEYNSALISVILGNLIAPEEEEMLHPKPVERWYRDLILAAEIGADRKWFDLRQRGVNVVRLQRDLRTGLGTLLSDPAQPLSAAERVRAGFLLGDLGDPRIPVTLDEWRAELAKIARGDESGYFCRIPAGEYLIGSADPNAPDEQKPQHRYRLEHDLWIARYPMTNCQWQQWVAAGGTASSYADNVQFNHPTQPVIGVPLHDAIAGAAWFSAQLGITLRLPSEREWEAAARGGTTRRYPWGDAWQEDRAATRENRETRGGPWSVPVGCFPAGASPVGVLDMAGNVWEWCLDEWQSYAGSPAPFHNPVLRVQRGGSYGDDRANVLCAARYWYHPPYDKYGNGGFRLCAVPHTH